jgi:predicted PurR-regulated permease PerM
MQTKIIERYFFFGLLFAVFVFTFFIFRPFWIVLVLGASFATVLHPIYTWLNKKKFPEWLSALLTVLFFLVVLCGPLLGIGAIVFNQSQGLYHSVVDTRNVGSFLDSVDVAFNNILPQGMSFDINAKVADFISFISNNVAQIFSTTFYTLFSFFIMLLSMFHFLKEGTRWKKAILVLSPLSDSDDEKIMNRLSRAVNGVMKGYLLIALAQGIVIGLGFAFFNVPNPALWGVVAAVTSLIPTIGTSLVSVPAIIFLFLTGNEANAVGLLLWSLVVVSTIDNLLSPVLIGKKIDLPPLLILFSILGGISLLGPVGILVGPLSVSLLYALVSIYTNEFKQHAISS